MEKSRRRFNSLLFLALMFFTFPYAPAQLVATKDLTNTAATPSSPTETPSEARPVTHTADKVEERDCAIGIRDGVIVREVPEKVQLEIVSIEPRLVYDGTTIIVTVRLKNSGDQPILVPWEIPPVEPDTDPKTGTKGWESATISLTLGTREDRRKTSYLKGEADLAATPSNRAQHIELLSGQWVDVKFKAAIECYSSESWDCEPLPSAGHTQLTARWQEGLSTHQEEGCSVWRGEYKSRTAESAPYQIVYVAASTSDEKTTPPR